MKEGKGMVEETGGITKPSHHSQEMSEHIVATMTDRLYLSHTCSTLVLVCVYNITKQGWGLMSDLKVILAALAWCV